MALRRFEIQAIYLSIQQSIGLLVDEAGPNERAKLRDLSVKLLNVKRSMIGNFDEVQTEELSL